MLTGSQKKKQVSELKSKSDKAVEGYDESIHDLLIDSSGKILGYQMKKVNTDEA